MNNAVNKEMELSKEYNSKESEKKWQKYWIAEKIFTFNPNSGETKGFATRKQSLRSKKKIYSIDTPPPTVSGKMHLGHAFSYSHIDFIARYRRMKGENVFFPWGFDDNGLATEIFVEKKTGKTAEQMSREEFAKLCLENTAEAEKSMLASWQSIGMSCDWDIFYRTISKEVQKISQKSFIDLYKEGRAYRKKDASAWCIKCKTAIAQAELEDVEKETSFVYIKFDIENSNEKIIIATTRPEMMPACVAIFVNPNDPKYKKLVGKKAILPFFNRSIPILTSEIADPEKGTGAVYFCTFGHYEDVEFFRERNLPVVEILNPDGTLNENAGQFKGMKISALRPHIIEKLKELGMVEKMEPLKHSVNVHERCGTDVEFLVTQQWFIKYLDLREKFLKAGREIKWWPAHMYYRLENWINGLKWDWCVSRQRYFGVPIPVWYCKKCNSDILPDEKDLPVNPLVDKPKKKCAKCKSSDFVPEKDIFDTWVTSSHTPEIAAKLMDKKMFGKLFPSTLRPQAHDIINFWLFYTLAKSVMLHNKVPWENAMISGYALDPKGEKMSKSKGNIIEPADLLAKFPADALRFWSAGSVLGEDLPFQEKDLVTGQKFITKIWNSSKLVLMQLEGYKLAVSCCKNPHSLCSRGDNRQFSALRTVDKWILSRLNKLIRDCTEAFENYNFSKVKRDVEAFYWHDFCDYYLEIVKDRLYNSDKYEKNGKIAAQYTLYQLLINLLKLIAPVMPHITEEVFQLYFAKVEKEKSIHISKWPSVQEGWADKDAEEAGEILKKLVAAVRQFKQSKNVSLGAELKAIYLYTDDSKLQKVLENIVLDLQGASRAQKIYLKKAAEGEKLNIDLPIELRVII